MGKSPRIADGQKALELFALGDSEDGGDIYQQHFTAASSRRATPHLPQFENESSTRNELRWGPARTLDIPVAQAKGGVFRMTSNTMDSELMKLVKSCKTSPGSETVRVRVHLRWIQRVQTFLAADCYGQAHSSFSEEYTLYSVIASGPI